MERLKPPEGSVLFEDKDLWILENYSNVDSIYGSTQWWFAENQFDRNLKLIDLENEKNREPRTGRKPECNFHYR